MNYHESVRDVIILEKMALDQLLEFPENNFDAICNILMSLKGKLVITGVGKSGHIGKKMAATFSSTGTPSFFMHSAEGSHGDLGMLDEDDIVMLLSNSGETMETLNLVEPIKNIGCKTIAMTANKFSTLSQRCDMTLLYPKLREADELNLAPTASSTVMLVIGDAIAMTLSKARNFTKDDFYKRHPGGNLGVILSAKGECR